jgi:diaminohydroxyphosphoribosylaminopyrimidine deaminase/5-amino-6-(5-phosphoribosylamino)uracil reductase
MTGDADARWMKRALRLAARGLGRTSPNPMVGALVVKRGRLVGEGYHRQVGGPHAEIWALRQAGAKAGGATMYVTLEPCCHHGRTAPCTDALIRARLARVVVACLDPDKRVSGRGIHLLRKAGIDVEVDVLQDDARRLNAPYFKHTTTGLPLVSLKAAMSLDGKIATAKGESKWITGERARAAAHRLRAIHDAVLVGVGTVLADDPSLTVRSARGRTPLRIVLTADERPPIIAVTRRAPRNRIDSLQRAGAEVWTAASRRGAVYLPSLLRRLAENEVQSVMVEGGGTVAESALAAGLADRVYFFVAPRIIGGAEAPTPVEGAGVSRLSETWRLASVQVRRVGEDLLITGEVVH